MLVKKNFCVPRPEAVPAKNFSFEALRKKKIFSKPLSQKVIQTESQISVKVWSDLSMIMYFEIGQFFCQMAIWQKPVNLHDEFATEEFEASELPKSNLGRI